MNTLFENLASQLREARLSRNLNSMELAELSLGDRRYGYRIMNFEKETQTMNLKTLEKVLESLNYKIVLVPKEIEKEVGDLLNR